MCWLVAVVCASAVSIASAEEAYEEVVVTDPYLELHTGPGQSYPVFYIAERGETVQILRRHTDWFEVRVKRQKQGWVDRAQLENTLTAAGSKKTFRDVVFDDYLKRHLELGLSYGHLDSDPMLSVTLGYRLQEHFLTELTFSQAAGNFSDTTLTYVSLVSQPFPDAHWSPYFSLGIGQFDNTPRTTLVGAKSTRSELAVAGLGVRYYLSRQFFLRGDYRRHVATIDVDRTDTFNEWSLGAAFFF